MSQLPKSLEALYCESCDGTGEVRIRREASWGDIEMDVECAPCEGTGIVRDVFCDKCGSSLNMGAYKDERITLCLACYEKREVWHDGDMQGRGD